MNELTTIKDEISTSISDFNEPFTAYLSTLGLPIEGVLSPIEDRKVIIDAIENEIKKIPEENRHLAIYLTRFISSVAAGLFDGAVTYLWNETIKSLRQMIISFDLDYFYKVCEQLSTRYKNLSAQEELSIVSDFDLLIACNRMGLITDHVFEIFKFINYMRNHSSAAHPTENEISAYDLLGWLDNCIKYAINVTPNGNAVTLKHLLYNIRTNEIPNNDLQYIGENIKNLPIIMIEDLLATLFGMFIDPRISQTISTNIKSIAKYIWDLSGDLKRHAIGDKYGYFRKNGDVPRKDKANDFLELVDGLAYKDEDSIAQELRETLANLLSTHNSTNNFYNEAPWAQQLDSMLPSSGSIPSSVVSEWVKTIAICYAGNGLGHREGVDEAAAQYYEKFMKNFDNKSIVAILNLMDDSTFLMDIDMTKTTRRFKTMCKSLWERCQNDFLRNALDYIVNANEPLSKVHKTSSYKDLLAKVNVQF